MTKPEAEMKAMQVAPRWPTRVFAINCLLKVMAACEGDETHFDLSLARQLQQRDKGMLKNICLDKYRTGEILYLGICINTTVSKT